MTIGQVEWHSNHGSGLAELVRKLLADMFHVTKLGAGEGDTRAASECQGTVISGLFMYLFLLILYGSSWRSERLVDHMGLLNCR